MGASRGGGRLSCVARLIALSAMCMALANCASSTKVASHHGSRTVAAAKANSGHNRMAHSGIVCDDRFGCPDRGGTSRASIARESYASLDDGKVVGRRPSECPSQFCGCEASRYVFGKVRPELNLASNWSKFPRASPAPGMVAVRNHHVMVLMSHAGGNNWLVHDGNSGGGLTRDHVVSLGGYSVVNPR